MAVAHGARAKDRYVDDMAAFLRWFPALARWAAMALLAAAVSLCAESPGLAFDLFATHEVTAQFAAAGGKPMANAPVRVFAPGDSRTPVETGHTDADGKFVFSADRDGLWSAEARTKSEVARVMIRVGGPGQQQQHSRIPPVVVIGGLIALVALAWWYRALRMRNQRRQP
ncbi:MAG TPA: hypothetical protein VMS01_20000 [Stellaceae bacterium]|nr:hypothetical protein [Stellaceae bacterium]